MLKYPNIFRFSFDLKIYHQNRATIRKNSGIIFLHRASIFSIEPLFSTQFSGGQDKVPPQYASIVYSTLLGIGSTYSVITYSLLTSAFLIFHECRILLLYILFIIYIIIIIIFLIICTIITFNLIISTKPIKNLLMSFFKNLNVRSE